MTDWLQVEISRYKCLKRLLDLKQTQRHRLRQQYVTIEDSNGHTHDKSYLQKYIQKCTTTINSTESKINQIKKSNYYGEYFDEYT